MSETEYRLRRRVSVSQRSISERARAFLQHAPEVEQVVLHVRGGHRHLVDKFCQPGLRHFDCARHALRIFNVAVGARSQLCRPSLRF